VLLADPVLAASDPDLDSLLNVNTPDDYQAARRRPAPEVTVQLFGTLIKVGRPAGPRAVRAATVGAAAITVGLPFGRHVTATLNGDQINDGQLNQGLINQSPINQGPINQGLITRDPSVPLAAGDTVFFTPAP
jgi:hypothetical protein